MIKNKLFKSLGLAVLLLTLLVSNVFAFSVGTTDGVWERIDSTAGVEIGARCERYGRVVSESFTPIDTLGIINNVNVGPGGVTEKYVRNSSVCQGDPDGDTGFAGLGDFGEWTRSTSNLWDGFGSHTIGTCTTSGLFISQYGYEYVQDGGTTWNPVVNPDRIAIEIYNGTGGQINLATEKYSLLLFTDDRSLFEVPLTGIVNANGVYVVGNTDAPSTVAFNQQFTNNDNYRTVVLVKDYEEAKDWSYGNQTTLPGIYTYTVLDENQVRYGTPSDDSCPSVGSNGYGSQYDNFQAQSGFGFDGQINSNFEPKVEELFPVGRFCHYNNPIASYDSNPYNANALNTVPLKLTINDIGCPAGQAIYPNPNNNDLTFDFLFTLDETSNNESPCAYGPDQDDSPSWPGGENSSRGNISPNRSGCADMVTVTVPPDSQQSFICKNTGSVDPDKQVEYFVSIMGFTSTTVGGSCPTVPTGQLQFNQVYTAEKSNNCYCMYAAYTKNQITPVTLASFGANWTESGVLIDWVTVTETNNLGFNIMRAESVEGERIQINPEMIFSGLAPGDPFGSSYEYLDETAVPGTEYFYWLVDVPLDNSEPGIYGPISPAE